MTGISGGCVGGDAHMNGNSAPVNVAAAAQVEEFRSWTCGQRFHLPIPEGFKVRSCKVLIL